MNANLDTTSPRPEIARTTLSVLFIIALIAGSASVLRPFIAAFIWAATIVVATWPLLIRAERLLGGRRGPAVALMTLALIAIVVLPVGLAARALVGHLDDLPALHEALASVQIPQPPPWVGGIPLVGARIAHAWADIAAATPDELTARLEPYVRGSATWFRHHAGTLAGLLVQFLLTAVLAGVLYAGGESWGGWSRRFAKRLAEERGDRAVVLAGQAIRGVALGVVVTALVQTTLGALGLLVAGVPFTAVLTAIMFMLCLAQVGPILVLLLATVWVFLHAGTAWGTVMLAWALAVGFLDNFLRPVLIRRGADLPLLLIFAGVVGGLIGFGIIGIFVGPVVLAVTYTLLDDWIASARMGATADAATRTGPTP
jgi:predicted PurR-regulated permease PerM